MATWPHAGMHMTKASTQAKEAFADAYRCGRQNVYFGLPKLTSESAKLTMSLELKHFLFVPLCLVFLSSTLSFSVNFTGHMALL